MIHTEFFQKDGAVCMEMQGHAMTAPKGEDLICAAATMVGTVEDFMETQVS